LDGAFSIRRRKAIKMPLQQLFAGIITFAEWPRWAYMWLIALVIFFACKLLSWRAAATKGVAGWRVCAYLLAWPGMNADRFFAVATSPALKFPTRREWFTATINLIAGAVIFWSAQHWISPSQPVLLGWFGMVGIILMLHFGSFHLLSCAWRSFGVDAPPLMNRPTRSTSVADFWGRRWNMAFRDLTHQFLFRPLVRRTSPIVALCLGFFVSGLIHDVVISVPAEGGYGGPTAFFCIQAGAILFERSSIGAAIGLGRGWRGWLFTAGALLCPFGYYFMIHS
jgi:Membrane bound O-acyl transferase family